jgi:hypothetical protein
MSTETVVSLKQHRQKRDLLYRRRLCFELLMSSAAAGDFRLAESAREMLNELEGASNAEE